MMQPGRIPALAALVVGGLFAALSVGWGFGGTWLLDTVGGGLEASGRAGSVGVMAVVWTTAVLKTIAAVLPVLLTVSWPRESLRVVRVLVWVEGIVLTGYGLVLTATGLAVQAGAVRVDAGADHRALAWHAFLWDPWFLGWGLLVLAVLLSTRAHRPRDSADGRQVESVQIGALRNVPVPAGAGRDDQG